MNSASLARSHTHVAIPSDANTPQVGLESYCKVSHKRSKPLQSVIVVLSNPSQLWRKDDPQIAKTTPN